MSEDPDSPVRIVLAVDEDGEPFEGDAIIVENSDRIRIDGFTIEADDDGRFGSGVNIRGSQGSVNDVTIAEVDVLSATENAGISITAPGNDICIIESDISGSGLRAGDANGVFVSPSGVLRGLEFVNVRANLNTADGFAVSNSNNNTRDLKFLGVTANNNNHDGFDIGSGTPTLVNVTANTNGLGIAGQGRGIGSVVPIHIENAHVLDNEEAGIRILDGPSRLIAATIAGNGIRLGATVRWQILAEGGTLAIFNTIAVHSSGDSVRFRNGGTADCGPNIFNRPVVGVSNCAPLSSQTPQFDASRKYLLSGSVGIDDGENPAIEFPGLIEAADIEDRDGKCRPHDGDGVDGPEYNIGAFESTANNCPGGAPSPTPTLRRTPVRSRTVAPTSTPTVTIRPTRTRMGTATPTGTPCVGCPTCTGDCNGDGAVKIDELIRAVGIALGRSNVSVCQSADATGDGTVSIAELVTAVTHSLNGCPAAAAMLLEFQAVRARADEASFWAYRGPNERVPVVRLSAPAAAWAGNRVQFSVKIKGRDDTPGGVTFDLSFSPEALFEPECELRAGGVHELKTLSLGPGRIRLAIQDSSFPLSAIEDGVLVRCSAVAGPAAQEADYQLSVSKVRLVDTFRQPLPVLVQNNRLKRN